MFTVLRLPKLHFLAWLGKELIGSWAISDPAGALITLMWNRDNLVLSDDELYNEK